MFLFPETTGIIPYRAVQDKRDRHLLERVQLWAINTLKQFREERLKQRALSAWKRECFRGSIQHVQIHEEKVDRRWKWGLLYGAQCQNQSQWAQIGAEEVPSEYQEAILCCAVVRALAQVAQRFWSLLLVNLQKPLGCGPEHTVLGVPA